MSRHHQSNLTAVEALQARMEGWKKSSADGETEKERAVSAVCVVMGERICKRIQTTLMANKYSPAWLNPILDSIEDAAKELHALYSNPTGALGMLFVEAAASRFESLELETRIEKLERAVARLS